jgi:glyoxylase I family protein
MSFQRRRLLQSLSHAFGFSFILSRDEFAMAAQNLAQSATEMEKVTGIGGLFFRAKDPKALGRWYQQSLGIPLTPTSSEGSVWQQEAGPTSFSPFPETSKYFGNPDKVWMVNFRVRDLDKMAAQLRSAGIEVKVDPQTYPYGRFARLQDPEGNPIELWQPAKSDAPH